MSIDATRWAWQQPVTSTQKLVLLSLADRANEHHVCYPSIARLCNDTGLHRETIMGALKSLFDLGLLEVDKQPGRGNIYTLVGVYDRHGKSVDNPVDKHTSRKKHTSMENRTTPVRKTGLPQYGKPDHHQYGKPDTESTIEPINEPTNESQKVEDSFPQFWSAYPYRKKVAEDAARKAWNKRKPPIDQVLEALAWQTKTPEWRKDGGQFIPNPVTYINDGRWKDQPPRGR
jgi:DNA-binding transcriptional ArsR family regulator